MSPHAADAPIFERRVEFRAAFDKRDPDPTKDYGIHGVEIRFLLIGPRGATQFVLYTNWQLPHVTKETMAQTILRRFDEIDLKVRFLPLPADFGYHAYEPQYDGHTRMDTCDVLTIAEGGCYYDGSSLAADDVYQRLLREGDAGVWAALEEAYAERFASAEVTP